MRELVRKAAKLGFAGADPFFGPFHGPRILIYHQIGAGLGRQMEVTLDAFTFQLDWMIANGSVVSLDEAIAARGQAGDERRFVLTFDDGYDDFYRFGYPELVKRSLPFTLYLTTHPVESREPLLPGGKAEPLTWAQVEAMHAAGGMTLAAHTHRHADLRDLDASAVEEDLARCDELIEQRLGDRPAHFAYPWGYWSDAADAVVRRRYASATLGSGPGIDEHSDVHLLHRVPVQLSDTAFFFKRKMRTGMRLEDIVRRRLKGYDGP